MTFKKGSKTELLNLHNTISPIYDMAEEKLYTVNKANTSDMEKTYDMNTTVINSATMVKKSSAKRDILARNSPDKKITSPIQIQKTFSRTSPSETGLF